MSKFHQTLLYLRGDVHGVWPVTDDPAIVGAGHRLPAHRARLVVHVPLLDAGQTVRVGARQDHVGPPLQTHAAILQ